MRVEFLTQEDPLYIFPLFDEFLRHYSREVSVVSISCCKTMGGRSRRQLIAEVYRLYGALGFLRLLSRIALSRALGTLRFRPNAQRFFSLVQLCRAYGVEYRFIQNPNDPDFVRGVSRRGADLIISVACPYILKRSLLKVPPFGCINIHHAPLPRYKGMMPTFWQLYHGESTVGLTIHYMTEKLDEGDALLQEHIGIQEGESLDHLIRRSKRYAAHCLARVLMDLESNSTVPVSLKHEKGSYFTFPNPAQIRDFRRRGLRAI